jgi:hypothetical protein
MRLLSLLLRLDGVLTFGAGVVLLWIGLDRLAAPLPYVTIGALLVWLALRERSGGPRKET